MTRINTDLYEVNRCKEIKRQRGKENRQCRSLHPYLLFPYFFCGLCANIKIFLCGKGVK